MSCRMSCSNNCKMFYFVLFLSLVSLACTQEEAVLPQSINFYTQEVLVANGSSLTGRCPNAIFNRNRTTTCNNPASSVLMDGNIPTLSGLNGDTWAEQLMILHQPSYGLFSFNVYFDFSLIPDYDQIKRVEVTLFNCLEWGAAINYFEVYNTAGESIAVSPSTGSPTVSPSVSSCDSLIKLCVPISNSSYPIQRVEFTRYADFHMIHIAEIAFFRDSEPCPYLVVIPPVSQSIVTEGVVTKPDEGPDVQVEIGGSSATQAILSFLAIVTALQTTVIFIIVIFVVYKYRQSVGVSSGTPTEAEYEYQTMNPVVGKDTSQAPKVPPHGPARRVREPSLSDKSVSYIKPQHQK